MKKTLGERYEIFQIILFASINFLFLIGIVLLFFFHQDSLYVATIIFFILLFCVLSFEIFYCIGNLKVIRKAIRSASYQTGNIVDVRVVRNYCIHVVLDDGRKIIVSNVFFGKYRRDFRNYRAAICFRKNRPILVDIFKEQK